MAAISQPRPSSPTGIRTPLFIFGVALAMLAFLIMFAFGIVYVGRTGSGGQSTVVVATRDIDTREPITLDMVKLDKWPTSGVLRGTYTAVADVVGLSAVTGIQKGEPISPNLVGNPDGLVGGTQSSYLPIPDGYVAMTMPTSEQQGVAGYIAQGDYIDVIATVNTGQFSKDNPRSVTKTVFTNLHVIRVGPQSVVPRQGQPQGLSSSITVVVTLCDAQYMDWLVQNATLKYTLLAYKNYSTDKPSNCPSTTSPGLIGPGQVDAQFGFTKGS